MDSSGLRKKERFWQPTWGPGDVKRQAGRAYAQLVSNTLDVFELLFNLKWHSNQWKSQNRKIVIREWNWEDDLLVLKKNVPVLGNAVES